MEDLWSNDKAIGIRVRTARYINSPPHINSPHHINNFSVNLDDNNMDYILDQPNIEEVDDNDPRSPAPNIQSSDTPSMPFVGFADTFSSRRSKRKGPTMDGIDEHFALLNTNIQQCVSSMKHGNQMVSELVDIARAQATTTQDVAAEIRRRNDLYAKHVHHHRRHASY